MKKLNYLSLIITLISLAFFTSCKDNGGEVTPERQTDAEFQTLITYLQDNDMDLDKVLTDWITTAATVNADLANYYVIDIRSADSYAAGHIPGAVNSALTDVVTKAADAGDKTIVVVCYSGQTAGHATCALRLSGYPTAKVLMWGMSGWHTSLDSWSGGCNTISSAGWVASPGATVDATEEYDDPDITETGDGATILAARVTSLLAGGLRGVAGADVLDNPGAYFINNYWAATDVETYGNIAGAHRINPLTLANGDNIHLDPDADLVTYCWTGQTSSMVTAYLYILGYKSLSLKNGTNSMIYDNLAAHKWDATLITDLTLEQ